MGQARAVPRGGGEKERYPSHGRVARLTKQKCANERELRVGSENRIENGQATRHKRKNRDALARHMMGGCQGTRSHVADGRD